MKEKIYTIPLNEAFDADTECPFCFLYEKLEQSRVEYTVGASMMEPDSRMVTNEKGFCNRHLRQMEKCQQALSLALVLDTHLNEVVKKLDILKGEIDALTSPKKGLFQKAPDTTAVSYTHLHLEFVWWKPLSQGRKLIRFVLSATAKS